MFGAFRSCDRHCFDEDTPVYRAFAQILAIRQEKIALRRGRQYLREISGDGQHFGLPHMIGGEIRSVVPWSRIFNDQEMLLAINTDPDQRVLTQGLVELAASQGYKGDWSGLFAGLVMAMLPVLAAYIIFQRQVVAGLNAGAMK